jgi:hypothetical protein
MQPRTATHVTKSKKELLIDRLKTRLNIRVGLCYSRLTNFSVTIIIAEEEFNTKETRQGWTRSHCYDHMPWTTLKCKCKPRLFAAHQCKTVTGRRFELQTRHWILREFGFLTMHSIQLPVLMIVAQLLIKLAALHGTKRFTVSLIRGRHWTPAPSDIDYYPKEGFVIGSQKARK